MGQTALPGNKNPDVVLITAKENMSADLLNELIGLHEKIVLQSGSELSENKNLPAHPDRRQGQTTSTGSTTTTCPTPSITVGAVQGGALVIYASCVEHQEFRLAQICAFTSSSTPMREMQIKLDATSSTQGTEEEGGGFGFA